MYICERVCVFVCVCIGYNIIILLAVGVSAHRQGQSLEPRRATRRPPPPILVSIPTMRYIYIYLFFSFHYYFSLILKKKNFFPNIRVNPTAVLRYRQMPFRPRVPGISFLSRVSLDGRQMCILFFYFLLVARTFLTGGKVFAEGDEKTAPTTTYRTSRGRSLSLAENDFAHAVPENVVSH